MLATIINQYGDATVFTTANVAKPALLPGHVLLAVHASSVNPIDCKIRSGAAQALGPALPAILHGDVAGIIVEVAAGVQGFAVGDAVYGCAGGFRGTPGALAQYMLADARLLAHKPNNLTMVEAAALPLVAVTAYEALFDRAQLQSGQTILLQGAAGGVGHIAVQLALAAGAQVFATASSERKLQQAVALGAVGINYTTLTMADIVAEYTAGKGFDVVMNTAGGASLQDAFAACTPHGVVVGIAARGNYDLTPLHSKGLSLHLVFMPGPLLENVGREQQGERLVAVTRLVEQGKIKPMIDSVFPFSQVHAAHQRLESGATLGKVVLTQDGLTPDGLTQRP